MDIALYDNAGTKQKVHQSGLGNRPAVYPFRQMQAGDYLHVPASKNVEQRRKDSNKICSAASQFARRNPEFNFSVVFDGKDNLVVTRSKA